MRRRLPPIAIVVAAAMAATIEASSRVAHASSGDVGDPGSTRRAYMIAGVMAALGVALLIVTVWFWRTTKPEHPVLGPLEVMGERRWRNADPVTRMRHLDRARSEGARTPGRARWTPQRVAAIDLKARARDLPQGFDDLVDSSQDGPPPPDMPHRHAIPRSRVDELEQMLAGLGIDPMPYVHERSDDIAGPDDETRSGARPVVLDPLLHRSDG